MGLEVDTPKDRKQNRKIQQKSKSEYQRSDEVKVLIIYATKRKMAADENNDVTVMHSFGEHK